MLAAIHLCERPESAHAYTALFRRLVHCGKTVHGCSFLMLGADPFGPRHTITVRDSHPTPVARYWVAPLPHLRNTKLTLDLPDRPFGRGQQAQNGTTAGFGDRFKYGLHDSIYLFTHIRVKEYLVLAD